MKYFHIIISFDSKTYISVVGVIFLFTDSTWNFIMAKVFISTWRRHFFLRDITSDIDKVGARKRNFFSSACFFCAVCLHGPLIWKIIKVCCGFPTDRTAFWTVINYLVLQKQGLANAFMTSMIQTTKFPS